MSGNFQPQKFKSRRQYIDHLCSSHPFHGVFVFWGVEEENGVETGGCWVIAMHRLDRAFSIEKARGDSVSGLQEKDQLSK